MSTKPLNGSLRFWVMGALLAFVLSLFGLWANSLTVAQANAERKLSENNLLLFEYSQRVTGIEVKVDSLKDETVRRLDKIDRTLDNFSTVKP